jgi:hypothetical protein
MVSASTPVVLNRHSAALGGLASNERHSEGLTVATRGNGSEMIGAMKMKFPPFKDEGELTASRVKRDWSNIWRAKLN